MTFFGKTIASRHDAVIDCLIKWVHLAPAVDHLEFYTFSFQTWSFLSLNFLYKGIFFFLRFDLRLVCITNVGIPVWRLYWSWSSVARLTRFEGRGHKKKFQRVPPCLCFLKKVPKGPPFAYVFWKNFQRVPPLLMFFEKISKGSPLCLCFLKKFQKQIIKGGSIGFFSPPPRFDGEGAMAPWPPPLKCATDDHCLVSPSKSILPSPLRSTSVIMSSTANENERENRTLIIIWMKMTMSTVP